MEENRLMILYDGYCNLCSWSVQWIIRNDPKKQFSFVPLQEFLQEIPTPRTGPAGADKSSGQARAGGSSGPAGADKSSGQAGSGKHIPADPENRRVDGDDISARLREMEEDSVILVLGDRIYLRTAAALRIAVRLRFPWPLLGIFFIVPRFLRDPFYRLVARYRKRWFGERSSCYVP